MCEHCGCQALSSVAELTREHETVIDLIGDLRSAHAHGNLAGVAATPPP